MKLTDEELRRLWLDAPRRFESSFVEKFGESLARERFNSIIAELLAARRVVETVKHDIEYDFFLVETIAALEDYDTTVSR